MKDDTRSKPDDKPEAPAAVIQAPEPKAAAAAAKSRGTKWKAFWQRYWRKKFITIPLTLLVLAGALLAVPQTRYPILGTFIQREYKIVVLDQSSNKPVSGMLLKLQGATATTDAKGEATLKVKVGPAKLDATKKYFKSQSADVLVGLSQKDRYKLAVTATGRQVPVSVVNTITGKPVSGAVLTASGTDAKTDKSGNAILVLPADQKSVEVTLKNGGYNERKAKVVITEQADKANTFTLTPAGKLYFLSRLSGKIDVVKTDLDGGNRQTVLAGTGKEDSRDTILLASRDWRYLALKSKRDGGENAKVYLIDAVNGDKLTTVDEGKVDFIFVGWSHHRFVFQVSRHDVTNWQDRRQALKSFDAASGKLTVLDESSGEGTSYYDYSYNWYGPVSLIGSEVIFYKNWSANYGMPNRLSGRSVSLATVRPDGSNKRSLKDFPVDPNATYFALESKLYAPDELYLKVPPIGSGEYTYFEYEDGKVQPKTDVTHDRFNEPYPTYLESPSSKLTFWSDQRDGKNTLFTGNADGSGEKQVAALSEYTQYGWYTDDYLLVSKGSSELAIMSVSGSTPYKVSDYHKAAYNFSGYGKGYGGL